MLLRTTQRRNMTPPPPQPSPRCRHDSTVRRVLTVLFPERLTGWSSTIAAIAHGNTVTASRQRTHHHHYPTTALEIRNAVCWVFYRYLGPDIRICQTSDTLGEITVELKLSASLSSSDNAREDTLIANELLHSLRILLANQRPHHPCSTTKEEDDEQPIDYAMCKQRMLPARIVRHIWERYRLLATANQRPRHPCSTTKVEDDEQPMDHATCKNRPLPALTLRDISERYWHRTVYWLCDILSLICWKFTIIVQLPRVPNERDVLALFDVTSDDMRLIHARTCTLRWRLLALRRRFALTRRCNNCTRKLFATLGRTLQYARITGTSDVTELFIAARFVRWYRQAMVDIATNEAVCSRHRRVNDNKWSSRFTIELLVNDLFVNSDVRMLRSPWSRSPLPTSSDFAHQLAIFAHDVAKELQMRHYGMASGIIGMCMTDDLFKVCHLIPHVVSLFGEESELRFAYDSSIGFPIDTHLF